MKPRVFVSSTYYDLKYLRERIELFLERFSFEPVLFESDKLTYEHGKPLDNAAYNEVSLCHMMLLIVGGRYGTPANNADNILEWQKKYDDEFVSITRKEYETAAKQNIPIFVFVDKNVYSEYQSFKENESFFKSLIVNGSIQNGVYKFYHADNHNIFYFIDTLHQKAIKTFEKVDEIENYLSNQFSGMFFLYLKKIQDEASNQKVLDSVAELNNVVKRMNEMVNGIGKRFLDSQELQPILQKQSELLIEFLAEKIVDAIKFQSSSFSNIDFTNNKEYEEISDFIAQLVYTHLIENNISLSDEMGYEEIKRTGSKTQRLLNNEISKIYPHITIEDLKYYSIESVIHYKMKPALDLIKNKEEIIKTLATQIYSEHILPF